jgi:hypothetical protein
VKILLFVGVLLAGILIGVVVVFGLVILATRAAIARGLGW